EGWLARVPDEVTRGDFRLCIAQCYVGQSLGRPEYTERWLAAAEAAPLHAPFRDGFTSREGALACVRAGHLWLTGDVGRALEAGRGAGLERLAAPAPRESRRGARRPRRRPPVPRGAMRSRARPTPACCPSASPRRPEPQARLIRGRRPASR